ncbi:MAG: hypothetical protein M3069_17310, partial [Chloroflexota bacterium]|nr:hypothetical protein [Chloroflexota bacterium]
RASSVQSGDRPLQRLLAMQSMFIGCLAVRQLGCAKWAGSLFPRPGSCGQRLALSRSRFDARA